MNMHSSHLDQFVGEKSTETHTQSHTQTSARREADSQRERERDRDPRNAGCVLDQCTHTASEFHRHHTLEMVVNRVREDIPARVM